METADSLHFWDIAGPLAIILFLVFFALSIWGYRKGSVWMILVCSLVSALVGFITAWSIGSIFYTVALLQIIAALYLFFRKNVCNKE